MDNYKVNTSSLTTTPFTLTTFPRPNHVNLWLNNFENWPVDRFIFHAIWSPNQCLKKPRHLSFLTNFMTNASLENKHLFPWPFQATGILMNNTVLFQYIWAPRKKKESDTHLQLLATKNTLNIQMPNNLFFSFFLFFFYKFEIQIHCLIVNSIYPILSLFSTQATLRDRIIQIKG